MTIIHERMYNLNRTGYLIRLMSKRTQANSRFLAFAERPRRLTRREVHRMFSYDRQARKWAKKIDKTHQYIVRKLFLWYPQ